MTKISTCGNDSWFKSKKEMQDDLEKFKNQILCDWKLTVVDLKKEYSNPYFIEKIYSDNVKFKQEMMLTNV